jgi:hypothetical protein
MAAAREFVQSRQLGGMTVTAINDGAIPVPVELTVPEEVWRQEIDADAEGRALGTLMCSWFRPVAPRS